MVRVCLPLAGDPLAIVEPDGADALSALTPADILPLHRAHGALLLRGFGWDLAEFARFARALCPTAAINESPGRDALAGDGAVQTVNTGDDAFPLHPELSREAWKPDVAMFACVTPPGAGGETTVADGIALVRALDPDLRDAMLARRIVHLFPTWPGLFEFWLGTPEPSDALLAAPPPSCPYRFRRGTDGRIVRSFTRPFLHTPMFADAPAFGNFVLFARDHGGRRDFPLLDDLSPVPDGWVDAIRAAGAGCERSVDWRAGDIVVLDNTRFLHGRRAISDPAGRCIATYFGYLKDAPRNPEEPPAPPWRSADFRPPLNPAMARTR